MPIGPALPKAGAEVGMHGAGGAYRRDVKGGVRVDGQRVDPGVPDMVVRKDRYTVDRRYRPGRNDRQSGEQEDESGPVRCRLDHTREYGCTADESIDRPAIEGPMSATTTCTASVPWKRRRGWGSRISAAVEEPNTVGDHPAMLRVGIAIAAEYTIMGRPTTAAADRARP
ncbi:MAG: hypothetical protein ABFC38_03015 [Methanospirillum sp.]